jgi:uncharacterized protein (DUF433 family)
MPPKIIRGLFLVRIFITQTYSMDIDLLKRITIIPGLMGGRPTIRGMRFPVADVLGYLAAGMTELELLENFTFLVQDDIKAALLYAAKKINHPVIKVNSNAA